MSKFEEQFCEILGSNEIEYVRNDRSMFGTPDFTFYGGRIVLFLHGCFWHGHNCKNWQLDGAWCSKISCTIEKDIKVRQYYLREKIRFLRVWECEFNWNKKNTANKIITEIERAQFHSYIPKKHQSVRLCSSRNIDMNLQKNLSF